jgi:hypothetical protein
MPGKTTYHGPDQGRVLVHPEPQKFHALANLRGTNRCESTVESETVTVKLYEPGAAVEDTTPESTPLDEDNVNPGGNDPEVRLNEYGGTPPDRPVKVEVEIEYATPGCPFGKLGFGLASVRAGGVQVNVIVSVEPGAPEVIAAVNVPVSALVVELKVTGNAVAPAVAVQPELNPLVELASEMGAAVFW